MVAELDDVRRLVPWLNQDCVANASERKLPNEGRHVGAVVVGGEKFATVGLLANTASPLNELVEALVEGDGPPKTELAVWALGQRRIHALGGVSAAVRVGACS